MCAFSLPKDDKLLADGDSIFYDAESSVHVDMLCLGVCAHMPI